MVEQGTEEKMDHLGKVEELVEVRSQELLAQAVRWWLQFHGDDAKPQWVAKAEELELVATALTD